MLSTTTTTLFLALLSGVAQAAPQGQPKDGGMSCGAQPAAKPAAVGKAIYFITNDKENAVVALPIGADGMLSKGTVTKTGGQGSIGLDSKGDPATLDALIGQSSLTVVGNNLFAVNAGCNTLTMMAISPNDPTSLKAVGQPAAVPGEFPNTVAASAKNKLACVGTTGAKAGISCSSFSAQGLGKMDALRAFDLKQTTPPMGPLNTVSQTFFSADESALFTTVKGDPAVNNTGFLSMFPVQAGNGAAALSMKDVRSSPNGTAVLFGSATMAKDPSMLFVTDASFGATVLKVDSKGEASVVGMQAINGQKATCWATISEATNSGFVTDVATNRVVEMSLKDASIIKQLDLSANGDPGLIDLKAAGNFVYALSPGNGTTNAAITVLDVSGGQGSMKQVQHFDLKGMAGKTAQGMAVLL
ncbi:3-carboxymuconate cyclase [Pyrenophora seminiperda CCB06]|uniref:3-carboxymuconate cyclase n=1 Tax=Pyrenophora seminiperda CCB06 TaxID=1302712 RepID=A0A3M7MDK9_9PLEO|nr:3-carboxymuconate cyclase [Pyrenophora seminiperda CCB06]